LFEPWNAKAVDQLFRLRSNFPSVSPRYDPTIVLVDLDDKTLQQLNDFYLTRREHALLIRNLDQMKVASVVYDFIFAARTQENSDRALIDAAADGPAVYFGAAFALATTKSMSKESALPGQDAAYLDGTKWELRLSGDPDGLYFGHEALITFPPLAHASRGLGFLNVQPDRDGIYRRAPLLIRYGDGFYPSIALRAVSEYFGVSPKNIKIEAGDSITLEEARIPRAHSVRDIHIPIDSRGNILINFVGPWGTMHHYRFSDILLASEKGQIESFREELQGTIAIVSEVSTGSTSIGKIPLDTNYPLSGLHANIINTILTQAFLHSLSPLWMVLLELILLAAILFLSIRLSSLFFSVVSYAMIVGYLAVAALSLFYARLIIDIVCPLLVMVFATSSIVTYRYIDEQKQKFMVRRSFEAYFPPSVVEKVLADPGRIASCGQKKELTILFSDIKEFTSFSSKLTPTHVQGLLNEYFEAMTEIVFKYEGTVDKFVGDGLMVFFGDPEPQPDHALRCVLAATEMQAKVLDLDEKWRGRGDMPVQIRIGINTGSVLVGNMGSARRLSYTVLGAAVNLAKRLESNAPVGGILISSRTHDMVREYVRTSLLRKIQVKGIREPVDVYEILGLTESGAELGAEIVAAAKS
jgi:adenylate cyclase